MAIKQFAIPLDDSSLQTGDTNFKALVDAGQPVTLKLTNVKSDSVNELNLITNNSGTQVSHKFTANVSGGTAAVDLTATQMKAICNDASGDDWDYVEADWTLGAVDTPDKSNLYLEQSGRTYDYIGWPPHK
jgi:hypothetical protein